MISIRTLTQYLMLTDTRQSLSLWKTPSPQINRLNKSKGG